MKTQFSLSPFALGCFQLGMLGKPTESSLYNKITLQLTYGRGKSEVGVGFSFSRSRSSVMSSRTQCLSLHTAVRVSLILRQPLGAAGGLPVAISRGVSAFLLLSLKSEKALPQKPPRKSLGHMPIPKPVTVMRDRITFRSVRYTLKLRGIPLELCTPPMSRGMGWMLPVEHNIHCPLLTPRQ